MIDPREQATAALVPDPDGPQVNRDHAKDDERQSPAGTWLARAILLTLVLVVVTGTVTASFLAAPQNGTNTDGPSDNMTDGSDDQVQTAGHVEVTARLLELPGEFLPNDGLYNYAFILKYRLLQTHRGQVKTLEFFVAHYNPRKPRESVADEFYPDLGGQLRVFRAGDRHRLALEVPIDEHYIGAIVDRYHRINGKTVYWAVWTNPVTADHRAESSPR